MKFAFRRLTVRTFMSPLSLLLGMTALAGQGLAAPTLTITTPASSGSYANGVINAQTGLANDKTVTLGGTCSDTTKKVVIGYPGLSVDPQVACTAGGSGQPNTWSTTVDLSGAGVPDSTGQGAVTISAFYSGFPAVTTIIIKDTVAPTLSLALPAATLANEGAYALTGTCSASEVGQPVSLSATYSDGSAVSMPAAPSCTSPSFGATVDLSHGPLVGGKVTFTAILADLAGNSTTKTGSVTLPAAAAPAPTLTITTPASSGSYANGVINAQTGLANDKTVALGGTCSDTTKKVVIGYPGLSVDPQVPCSGSPGRWSTTVDLSGAGVPDSTGQGAVTISAFYSGFPAVTTIIIKDTVAPTLSLALPAATLANEGAYALTGTCSASEVGQPVTLSATYSDGSTVSMPAAPACATPSFGATIDLSHGPLAGGKVTFTARIADLAGNSTTKTGSVTLPAAAAPAPTLTITTPASSGTYANGVINALTGLANDKTVALGGTCSDTTKNVVIAYPGLSVDPQVPCSGSPGRWSTTVDLSGAGVPDSTGQGAVTISAFYSGFPAVTTTIIKDTAAPTLSLTLPAATLANEGHYLLSGTCSASEAGQPVTLSATYAGGASVAMPTSPTCSSSTFSATIDLSHGSSGGGAVSFTATLFDLAGNSTVKTGSVTLPASAAPTLAAFTAAVSPASAPLNTLLTCNASPPSATNTGVTASSTYKWQAATAAAPATFTDIASTAVVVPPGVITFTPPSGTTYAHGQVRCVVTTTASGATTQTATSAAVAMLDSAPVMPAPALSSSGSLASPHKGDTLTCTAAPTDVDGDPMTTSYTWNNTSAGSPPTGSTYQLTALDRGNAVTCSAQATDIPGSGVTAKTSANVTSAASATALDRGPSVSGVAIVLPALPTGSVAPYANSKVTCSASVSDLDGDSVTTAYTWTQNPGASQVVLTPDPSDSTGATLSLTDAMVGHQLICTATARDNYAAGPQSASASSASATVDNGAACTDGGTIPGVIDATAADGEPVACKLPVTPAQGDTVMLASLNTLLLQISAMAAPGDTNQADLDEQSYAISALAAVMLQTYP